MKSKKRIIAGFLVFALAVSVLSGCAPTQSPNVSSEVPMTSGQGEQKTDELYTLKMLVAPSTFPERSSDTVVGKYVAEHFGIDFEYIAFAGDLREKQNLMLSAEDYGEIQNMQRADIVANYVNAGALIELDPYLEQMPDFAKRYENTIPYWRLSGNGKLYKWETLVPNEVYETTDMLVRSDLLEENGWKVPLSADEWITFLENALKNHPTTEDGSATIGLTTLLGESWGLAGVLPILYEKGDTYSPISNEGFTYNLKTKQFEDYFTNPYVKESFQFFNQAYRKGILDTECFTDTYDKTLEKAQQGRALAVWYVNWMANDVNTALIANGKEKLQYVRVPVQSNKQVSEGQKRELRIETTRAFDSYGITKKCKDPEKVLKLINWASSDEGQIILNNGLEGEYWTRGESGKREPTETLIQASTDAKFNLEHGVRAGTNIFPGLPLFYVKAPDGQFHNVLLEAELKDEAGLTARQKEVYQNIGWENSESWYEDNGFLAETGLASAVYLDTTSDLGKINQKMTEVRIKHSAKLVMTESDEEFEQAYQDAMKEYDKLDHASVIAELNRLLNEQQAVLEKYQQN